MGKLRINGNRLWDRLDELAQVGAIPGTLGSSRLALTKEDGQARDLVVSWMRQLEMEFSIDQIGNVIGLWHGKGTDRNLPPVMTGSHIDTVRSGGRFDGNLGVLAGLEIVQIIKEQKVPTEHPVAVSFFTGEEGARFAPDMLGSLVYVGGLDLQTALDTISVNGEKLSDELKSVGYSGTAPCPGITPKIFLELHIEQGPVLESEGIDIGAVESVQGISWTELTIEGQSNHAGTTPMTMRRDAGYVAGRISTFVRELTDQMGGAQVGTVGKVDLTPNLVNVVASKASMTVDLRNTSEAMLREAEDRLATFCEEISRKESVKIASKSLARFEPVEFNQDLVSQISTTAKNLGYTTRQMTSGAGHDAQMLARVCPAAMIFVPSKGGLSHNPAEYTSLEERSAGAYVLSDIIVSAAGGCR